MSRPHDTNPDDTKRDGTNSDDAIAGDDLHEIERSLLRRIGRLRPDPAAGTTVAPMTAATLVEAQITSRLLDHTARWLRAEHGLGHYTIGSAGHEANALIALGLRPSDPALLHYRSGGFYVARSLQARQRGIRTSDPVDDVLRGMLARSTEPIAGGRHKVFGHRDLAIIPQTSTIASHLPRAVGLALSFELATDRDRDPRTDSFDTTWPSDSAVVCSFGDGSLNHSTAQGALNWAAQLTHAGRRVPVLFVCEDNGLGLSVPTTPGWVAASAASRPALRYVHLTGDRPDDALAALIETVDEVRQDGRPAFVHLDTVRFLGHAGTDVEGAYRSPESLRSDLERDPIVSAAQLAVDAGCSTPTELVDWYLDTRAILRTRALDIARETPLVDAADVMAPLRLPPLARPDPSSAGGVAAPHATLAQAINSTLAELLAERPEVIVFGEDVGRKGGVYGVTRGLQRRFGERRVFDTVLDEQSVLGLALGSALNGFVPIPEIQYLAYLHNAEDQLRGEAASLAFFSNRQFLNPMVVRIAGYGYQRGFGGHFHNDNSVAVLRDIPGLVIASPAHPSDAGPMLRTCVEHAAATGAVCVFLEPIARYHTTDLHETDDLGWTTSPDADPVDPLGARVHGDGADLTIVTWANGAYLSHRAARRLMAESGIDARVIDLRWLSPLPLSDVLDAASATGRVLVVDETRRTGGVGEGIVAEMIGAEFDGRIGRIASHDSFVPLGDAAAHVLVGEDDIVAAARALLD